MPQTQVWGRLLGLAGQQLRTLDRGRPFQVLGADGNSLVIRVLSTGHERRIHRDEVEGAWRHLEDAGNLSRTDINVAYSPWNPAYVAALLAAVPGVEHTARPITLWYRPRA